MAERRKADDIRNRKTRNDHSNDIRLRLLKKDGDKIMTALDHDKMAGILSENEIMYVFAAQNHYLCYIHPIDAEEGRSKSFPINEMSRAMIKNLAGVCDQIFEITPKKNMDPMGVMVAAEKGIIRYLDVTGQLPMEDTDFMSWKGEPDL